MTAILGQMLDLYTRAGWGLEEVPGQPIASVTYEGSNSRFVFVASADDDTQTITVFARAPQACPVERLDEMSWFLHRLNFGFTHGAWVIDRSDGEIRFRVGFDVGDSAVDASQLQSATNFATVVMDQTIPALDAIITEGATSADAYTILYG